VASAREGGAGPDGQGNVVLLTIADAFVRGGTYADLNYGSDLSLTLKNATAVTTREAYLKFDLSGVGSLGRAALQLSGSGSSASVQVGVFAVADISWDEHLITWNNRPAQGALINTAIVQVGRGQYEFDVTGHVTAELAAGQPTVSLGLQAVVYGSGIVDFDSPESASGPRLLLAPP
jgi:hypothetical protein